MAWREELEEALTALISSKAGSAGQEENADTERLRRHATGILSSHPALRELLPTSDSWHLHSLGSGYPCNTEKLKSDLIDHVLLIARETGVETAARTCEEYLKCAAEPRLPGFELTFIVGLKLTTRWDIVPGLYVVPYPSLQQQFRRRRLRFPDTFLSGLDPSSKKNITVLVSELRWGPAITSANRSLSDSDPVTITLDFNHNPFLLIALLSVVLGRPLRVVANALRAAPWIDDFLDKPGGGGANFDPEGRINSSNSKPVSAEDKGVAEQAVRAWDSSEKADRGKLSLPVARLSSSLSRGSSWAIPNLAAEDRVLDISIALEILYGLDAAEITYKLSTRAGWYLGSTAEDRLRIRKTISDFYGLRSAIIHGRKPGKSDRNLEIHNETYNIAKDTLLKHLARGYRPDDGQWNEIVMGHVSPEEF